MTNLDHRHIAYLKRLDDVAEKFEAISATKKKLVMDMIEHDLVYLDNDFILIRAKATNLILHLEAEANKFLKDHG